MRPIPQKLRKQLSEDPFMAGCCYKMCGATPQWHHVWKHNNRQINEWWNILPACPLHHMQVKTDKQVKEYFEWVTLQRATLVDVLKYSKQSDLTWINRAWYLNIQANKYKWKL